MNMIRPNVLYLQQKGESKERNAAKEEILEQQQTLKVQDGVTDPPTRTFSHLENIHEKCGHSISHDAEKEGVEGGVWERTLQRLCSLTLKWRENSLEVPG